MWRSLAVIVFAAVAVSVRADYQVEVRFFSYQNPSHMRNNGECCDGMGDCGDNDNDFCDNVFLICLNEDRRPIIPCSTELSLVEQDRDAVVPNNDSLTFEEGPGGLLGLPNPVVINISGPWPNDSLTELTIVVFDADGMMDLRFIGDFRINITTLSPGDSTGLMQFDSFRPLDGLHANLSITVQCAENFYGVDCSRVCVDTDSELGHYTCDSQGFIVCSEGYRNTSTNCTECIPAEGCSEVGGYCEGPGDCLCLANYTGDFCEVDLLGRCVRTMPCQNEGTCVDSGDGGFNCTCTEEFEGERCQSVRTDECDPDPCQNGANCVDDFKDYTCQCVEGYGGKNCSSNIDDCQSSPCLNGGNCTDLLADYMCTCPTGYTGRNCNELEGESSSQSGDSPAALAGGLAGIAILLVVIVILAIVLVYVLKRKRHRKVVIAGVKSLPQEYEEFSKSSGLGDGGPVKPQTNTGTSVEHDFDNPIYGDDQEEYAEPVKPVPPSSGVYYSSADAPPHEYDYTAPPSGLQGPGQVYDSADDPSTAIPQAVYSYADPPGTKGTKQDKPVPPVHEYDYTTPEMNQPMYAEPEHPPHPTQHYEMMPTTTGAGNGLGFDPSEHYEFGPN